MTLELATWMVAITVAVIAFLAAGAYLAFRVEQRRLRREKARKAAK